MKNETLIIFVSVFPPAAVDHREEWDRIWELSERFPTGKLTPHSLRYSLRVNNLERQLFSY